MDKGNGMKCKVEIEISEDVLECAFEGARANYWIKGWDEVDGMIYVLDRYDESDHVLALTDKRLQKGVELLADHYPDQFRYLMVEDWKDYQGDAETGNLLVQLSLFGSVQYG